MAGINATLTPEEFESLRQVSLPTGGRIIPDSHKALLKELGFIEQKLGGWTVTALGQARVAMGR